MTLKILDDRIQLTEPNSSRMRQQTGRTTRSETITFSGRQVGRSADMRILALNIRNLNQLRTSIPIVSENYDWAGWCDIVNASASTREFTKAEGGHPGTTAVTWSITVERIEGQQEVRILGKARPHTGSYTASPRIGLPEQADSTFFPLAVTNPPASSLETFDSLRIRRWRPTYAQIESGLRYVLDPRDGHVGQVKIDFDGNPVVGLQPHTRSPSRWSMTNGMMTVESTSNNTFRIRSHKSGGFWSYIRFGSLDLPDDISVVYNTYFMAVLGLNFTSTGNSRTQVHLIARRGDPYITVEVIGYPAALVTSGWTSVLGGRGRRVLRGGMRTLISQAFGGSNDRRFGIVQDTGDDTDLHSIWLAGLDQWVRMVQL